MPHKIKENVYTDAFQSKLAVSLYEPALYPFILNQRRIIPLLFIVAAHLLILQLLAGFHLRVPAPVVVMPVEIYAVPVLTKFAAASKKVSTKMAQPRVPVPDAIVASGTPDPTADQTIAAPPAHVPAPPPPEVIEPTIPAAKATPAVLTLPPPSANYLLDVMRTEPNVANPYYGSGAIQWQHNENSYRLHLEVSVDLLVTKIRLYNIESEGTIGETGIKPKLMTETRRSRSSTATHFNYDTNTISFSASTAVIPMSDGAQDRATVLMQLASIGNADPNQFQTGKEITIQVAEDKDASLFQFVILGQETIDTQSGQVNTWHIVRPPKPGSYSSRLDVWVAPDMHWLPVQIRNTESNGAITTETIRKIIYGPEE